MCIFNLLPGSPKFTAGQVDKNISKLHNLIKYNNINHYYSDIPNAAAVQWAIINPEFRPPSGVRKAGNSLYAIKM